MRRTNLSSLAVLCAVPALAQTNGTYLIQVSGTVSPARPTVSVEIWAAWDQPAPGDYYLYAGDLDLVASDGAWSNPSFLITPNSGGWSAGVASGSVISGVLVGQMVCGPVSCGSPNVSNPYPLISAEWTTTDFTPRSVQLFSEGTMNFILGHSTLYALFQLYPGNFTPGSGVINVVPAPAAWPLGVLLFVSPGKRRRR